MIYDIAERRDMLSKLDSWNFGILPNGKLASVPCFVHESVPDIKPIKNDQEVEEIIPIATKSEYTKNLVKSQIYYKNINDNSTLSSLSLCKATFQDEPAFRSSIDTIHYVNNHPKAYIQVSKIARLTWDCEEDIKVAMEYWPEHPYKSWDKLCQIWYKYGFLWPEYLYLDHSPDPTIIWRTHLCPIYEFFPTLEYKEFMMDMIYYFTGSIMNGKEFRLKNIKTGNYLGRQRDEIIMAPVQHDAWTLQDRLEPNYKTPYLCTDSKKIICASRDQGDVVELLIMTNNNNDGQLRLVNYHIPINTPFNKIYIDGQWQWNIQSLESYTNSRKLKISNMFNLDLLIEQHKCLKNGDTVLLNQSSLFLCEMNSRQVSPMPSQRSTDMNSPVYSQNADDSFVKPPSSISTNRDIFNFSSISESNSTQPTIDSDKSKHYLQKSFTHLTFPYLKNIDTMKKLTDEFQWKIELLDTDTVLSSLVVPAIEIPKSEPVDIPLKSQWLDGNNKLYNLISQLPPENILQSNSSPNNFETPAGSIQSIPSDTSVPIISAKKLGKQPLRKDQDSSDSGTDSEWTESPSSSLSSTPKNKPAVLSEAEQFKRQVQQEFNDKLALASIYKNVMFNTTPMSNTTSQIQYYDDPDIEEYTMTTPSSSPFLMTPEEQKSRESSFMLLVKQESKHEILKRAMEKSTLNTWIRALASPQPSNKKVAPPMDTTMKTLHKKKSFDNMNRALSM